MKRLDFFFFLYLSVFVCTWIIQKLWWTKMRQTLLQWCRTWWGRKRGVYFFLSIRMRKTWEKYCHSKIEVLVNFLTLVWFKGWKTIYIRQCVNVFVYIYPEWGTLTSIDHNLLSCSFDSWFDRWIRICWRLFCSSRLGTCQFENDTPR